MVYAPCHLLVIVMASIFLALPTPVASAVVLCTGLAYSQTYVGNPGHSGACSIAPPSTRPARDFRKWRRGDAAAVGSG